MLLIYLLMLFLFLTPTEGKQPSQRFIFEIQNFTCESFTTHIKHLQCYFFKIGPGRFALNFRALFDQNLGKDSDISFGLNFIPLNSINLKKPLTFFDVKLNLCVATSQQFTNMILKGFIDELRRTSNIPYSCPLKAFTLYRIDNYTLSDKIVPFYMPFSNATFISTVYRGGQKVLDYIVRGTIRPPLKV